jgi:murein L,D-transpeptidase YafK
VAATVLLQRIEGAARQAVLQAILLLCLSWPAFATTDDSEIWLLVDGANRQLRVMRGAQIVQSFEDILVGRAGIGDKRRRGDDVTPSGEFRIAWVARKTQFHRFFGINYPNRETADQALSAGVIDAASHARLLSAIKRGELPSQHTPLGGQLGIHGLGGADPRVHQSYNWTRGCVALTNGQVDALARWIGLGTRVVIR